MKEHTVHFVDDKIDYVNQITYIIKRRRKRLVLGQTFLWINFINFKMTIPKNHKYAISNKRTGNTHVYV